MLKLGSILKVSSNCQKKLKSNFLLYNIKILKVLIFIYFLVNVLVEL